MNPFKKKIGLSICFIILCNLLSAQLIDSNSIKSFKLNYWGYGDNREFANNPLGDKLSSETYFGFHVLPQYRINIDTNLYAQVGLSLQNEFGTKLNESEAYLVSYVYWKKSYFDFYFGSIPKNLYVRLDRYPRIVLNDTIAYKRSIIQGFVTNFYNTWSSHHFWLDWTGKQSKTRRESFLAGLHDNYNYNNFYLDHYFTMFHNAGKVDTVVGDVKDNIADLIFLSYKYQSNENNLLFFRAGKSFTAFRDRELDDGWSTSEGILVEIDWLYKSNFEINHKMYLGEGEYNISQGFNWYKASLRANKSIASSIFYETNFIYKFLDTKNYEIKFMWDFYILEGSLSQTQRLFAKIYL